MGIQTLQLLLLDCKFLLPCKPGISNLNSGWIGSPVMLHTHTHKSSIIYVLPTFNIIVSALSQARGLGKNQYMCSHCRAPTSCGFFKKVFLGIFSCMLKNKVLSTEEDIQNCHFRAIQNAHEYLAAMYEPYLGNTWFLVAQAIEHSIS